MADYETVRDLARRLTAELYAGQADGARAAPRGGDGTGVNVSDLDSFSLIELVLAIEAAVGVKLLEVLADFPGGTVDDLAAFAVRFADRHGPGHPGVAGEPDAR